MRVWIALAVAMTVLAGCAGSEPSDPDPTGTPGATDTTTGTSTGTSSTTTTSTGTGSPGEGSSTATIDVFTADTTSGEAPLEVTFRLEASFEDGEAMWRISFGDGNDANGTADELPQDVSHTYVVGGTFVARATITDSGGTASSENITITVTVPAGETPQLVFTFGPSAGCTWDLGGTPCASEAAGPDAPVVDGHWLALDDRYWGMSFSSTVTRGGETGSSEDDWPLYDTDCFFFGEDTATRIGEGNNGGGPCGSAEGVPEGAMWLFITPYALPAEAMELTFGLPPA